MSSSEYVEIFVECMPLEISEEIMSAQFALLATVVKEYTPKVHRSAIKANLFGLCMKILAETPAT